MSPGEGRSKALGIAPPAYWTSRLWMIHKALLRIAIGTSC